jgi:hypothetical protein
MKNIFLLPTDKPSRLFKFANQLHLDNIPKDYYKKYNIYITSDEKIKEGDWGLSKLNEVILFGRSYNEKFYKKIILTTDQDLIADGVQAIDDEFLEWYVKNPSCEFVEVRKYHSGILSDISEITSSLKIIIPKEESKQEGYICPHTKIQCDDECCVSAEDCHITSSLASGIFNCDEPRQETLEEAAENFANSKEWINGGASNWVQVSFKNGAKWQSKRMYSEEEVLSLILKFNDDKPGGFDASGWFEQFKKK